MNSTKTFKTTREKSGDLVSSSCSTCVTHRVTLVTKTVIIHKRGNDRIVITTNGTYPWSFVTQILRNG